MIVSIIIPIYKVENYIQRCLLSVINQTYKNIELILIDDCGNDRSIEIANKILKFYDWEKKSRVITHQENKGLSAARNRGIIEARGSYIYFLDSDDSISLDCIEKLIIPANNSQCDFTIGDYLCIQDSKEIYTEKPPLKLHNTTLYSNDEILKTFQNGEWYSMAVNKLIRRDFLIENKLFFTEGIIHEDELWSFKLACKANIMSVVNDTTYYYHLREDSITGLLENNINDIQKSQIKLSNESKIEIIKLMYDYINSFKLLNNNILTAYEVKKDILFYTILKSNYYSNEKLCAIYCNLKSMRNIKNSFIWNKELDIKTRIKLSHYIFPSYIGFLIYKLVSKYRK